MNILDTFFFMFEADTSGVQKGTEAGEASTKKLKKAVDDVDLSADKLAANFVNMAKNAAGALAGILTLGAIKVLINDTAAHTTAVALQARAMNMSVETFSAYQAMVISMGGTTEEAAGTLHKLRDGFVEMARFGTFGVSPMTMAFQQLGATAKDMHAAIKDPTIALSAIADNFAKLDRTKQIFIGQKLGLDQGTIMLLAQGRRAFDELMMKEKELHAVTEDQARASMKYTIAQKELGLTFEAVKRDIVQQMLPAFTWIVQGLDKVMTWMREHRAVAIATFGAIGTVIALTLIPPLVTAAAAMWALMAPVLIAAAPFIALGLAIGLIADDIDKFVHGQKSVIGVIVDLTRTFMANHPLIGQTAHAVAQIVEMATQLIVSAFKWLGGVLTGEALQAWADWKKNVFGIIDALMDKFPEIGKTFKLFVDGWHDGVGIMTRAFDVLYTAIKKVWDMLANAPTKVLNWIGHGLARLTGGKYDDIDPNAKPAAPATPAATVRAGQKSPVGRQIADKLVAMGWTPEQAAGIAGNAIRESGGDPNAKNSIGMYGLFQWDTQRRAEFAKWAGHDIHGSSMDEQLAFFNYETTKGKEQRAGRMIRAAQTPEDAALAAAHGSERYGDHPDEDRKRVAAAQAVSATMNTGREQLAAAGSAPLAQPGSVVNTNTSSASRSTTVQVGDVHVQTAATDPAAVGKAVTDALKTHINNAIDQHDDGIAG